MNDKDIRKAKTLIKTAVILRLLIMALLALGLTKIFSDERLSDLRIFFGFDKLLLIVIPGLLFDMVMTLLWLYKPDNHRFHYTHYKAHAVMYVFPMSCIYVCYSIVFVCPSGSIDTLSAFFALFIWITVAIPFVISGIGFSTLWKRQKGRSDVHNTVTMSDTK